MSEYQYYEFQAIDRRLTAAEMAELRSVSSRARITPTSFVNEYEWGTFKGDADAWMERFDAFLHFANWGTRVLKLRVSAGLLDLKTAQRYCTEESARVRESGTHTIVTFSSEIEDDEWPDESDALAALVPIRTQLAGGDLRAIYLGWLVGVQAGEVDDDATEPPVPPGLRELDGSLERLVDFLRISEDLLDEAAAASAPLRDERLTREAIRKWIAERPQAEKDDYLERFIAAEEAELPSELQRTIGSRVGEIQVSHEPRSAGALVRAAEQARTERIRAETSRGAIENKRREEEAALARSKYLAQLATREPAVWIQIDDLIATKQPASYDRAAGLLVDLHDAAARAGREPSFLARLDALRTRHARKPSLLSRLDRAGLR